MTTAPLAPDDSPLPSFTVPVTFKDGSLSGLILELPNDVHHYKRRETGEEWQRHSEAADGTLRSFFTLKRPHVACQACGGTGISRPNPPANSQ